VLTHGEFFGEDRRQLRTESFAFASMVPTWTTGEVPRHSHENSHFVQVLRGTYITAACNDLCGPSTLVFNPPGTTHRDRFHSREGRFFTVSLSAAVSERLRSASPVPILLRDPRILRILHDARGEVRQPDGDSALVLEALGFELAGCTALLRSWPDARAPRWLLQAREQLREGSPSGLTITALARSAGVHRVHLARAFRQYFRCTPGEYRRVCRIEKALRLLAASDLPLAEVAQQLGFCDQSQLTHAFRRATGSTPGQYRRSLRD
jgi:AraC family transcriptional regulator